MTSPLFQVFEPAFREANDAQLKDDDDLPSLDDILNQFSSAPSTYSSAQLASKKEVASRQRSSLTIPGELILALADRFYYPARIASFNNKSNKYKVEYATGHSLSIERKKFFTRYEKGFQTCQLGVLALPVCDDFEDPELEAEVRDIYPTIYAIITGVHDKAGRLEAFMKGGKARRSLAQKVGPGDFSRAEYAMISNMLQTEFLPDLITTKKLHIRDSLQQGGTLNRHGSAPPESSTDSPMKGEGDLTRQFSDQMRLHFVTDVLLPETVTQLTMRRCNITYEEADRKIMEGARDESTDTWWVDDVLAARESFLDGHPN
ncbi:hypothetical protein BGX28_009260 [Mortierella sp. GBA30]|nr:hypothetical protein BGX28_009260 [Mortierella sp. GBA30]